MATIPQNIYIDIDSNRIVRENNPLVGLRSFQFTEGNVYTGEFILRKNGITGDSNLISNAIIEVGNSQNDVALVGYEGSGKNLNLSFNGNLLRQYLYNSETKEAVFSIGLTYSGIPYVIDSVPVKLSANPSGNIGGISWAYVTDKPETFEPAAHNHSIANIVLLEEGLLDIHDNIQDVVDNLDTHVNNSENPHNVTKDQIGLGDVDNTSDLNKPISNDVQTALDGKVDVETGKGLSTEDFTTTEKTKLQGIEENAQVNTVHSVNGKSGMILLDKGDLNLGAINNTSDLDKPISTATQTALNTKSSIISVANQTALYNLTSSNVKLGDVVIVQEQSILNQIDEFELSNLTTGGNVSTNIYYDGYSISVSFNDDTFSGTINNILTVLESGFEGYGFAAQITGNKLTVTFTDSTEHIYDESYSNNIDVLRTNLQSFSPFIPRKFYLVKDLGNLNNENGYLDLEIALNEINGNLLILQEITDPTDTDNYVLTLDTTGSAVLNCIGTANQYGNIDFSLTEKETGNRWALAVYNDSPGGSRNGKFGFNSVGVGDAFELHTNLNAFFNGNLAVGENPTLSLDSKLTIISTTTALKAGYNSSNYFTINVSSAGLVTLDAVGSSAKFRFSDILSTPQTTKANNATGTAGDICWDSNYIYVCTATNTWKRVALSTF